MEGLDRGEDGLSLEVLTWNLFHGRDHPPGELRGGFAWRLFGRRLDGDEYALLNRDLRREFVTRLDGWSWDVALLQEVPVGWIGELSRATGAAARLALTSRNWMSPVTAPIWARRPHLIGSWEGGCNAILVRGGRVVKPGGTGAFTLRVRPERRRLHFVELEGGPMVFNLHASTGVPRAAEDVLRAAGVADREAAGRPFVFGGDLNVSPAAAPRLFDRLAEEHGVALPGGVDRDSIDQVLMAGAVAGEGERLPAEQRDLRDDETGLKVRLSDHDPVVVRFEL